MTWLHENCVPGKSKLVWCLNLGSVDFQFCACNILLICFSSAQSCPTLCGPMDCSTPGLPVRHQLSELTQTHPVSQWCHPTISSSVVPFSSRLQFHGLYSPWGRKESDATERLSLHFTICFAHDENSWTVSNLDEFLLHDPVIPLTVMRDMKPCVHTKTCTGIHRAFI